MSDRLLDNNFSELDPDDVSVTNVDLVDPYGVAPRISAGYYHNLVLASDGTVWGWGACSDGQLDTVDAPTCSGTYILPQRLNISGASAVSAGDSFSVIAKADGTVSTCGKNTFGQLGHIGGSSLSTVDGLTDVKTVSAGGYHVLALKNDGSVWAWGNGGKGQLGNGDTANSPTPVQATGALIGSGKSVTAIAAGREHSLALGNDQKVYIWGSNLYYQLGLGTATPDQSTPTAIFNGAKTFTNATAIAAGWFHSFAVGTYNGAAGTYGWGWNSDYQLGVGSPNTLSEPTGISITGTITRLSGGYMHSLALVDTTKKVWAWGDNENIGDSNESEDTRGALGLGNTTDKTIPTSTLFPSSGSALPMDVSAGRNDSLVLLNDGRIQSTGVNDNAQLGTNEIAVSGVNNYTATPKDVEDPGDTITGSTISFYAYRPILSGQPATATTITSTTVAVCWDTNTNSALPNCGPITHYSYSLDGTFWSAAIPIATPISLSADKLIPGTTVTLWAKGMTSISNAIQTTASAAKVSWEIIAP